MECWAHSDMNLNFDIICFNRYINTVCTWISSIVSIIPLERHMDLKLASVY